MTKILLVEDDPGIGKGLKVTLELEGYGVIWAETLAAAKAATAKEGAFDLVILDLNLPDGSGLTFARSCRSEFPAMPVLMLTASSDEESVVAGFEAGAIDYVRKPFSNKELKARIQVVLKDKSKTNSRTLQYGTLTVLQDKRLVKVNDASLELNRREFDILCYLVTNAETVVTRESLLRLLDKEGEIFDRTIDSHVSHLRSRLRKAGLSGVQISTVYGVGYRLEAKNVS
ncbi:MAG: response regulator transcription factor [Bdellovibrionota bacterium]